MTNVYEITYFEPTVYRSHVTLTQITRLFKLPCEDMADRINKQIMDFGFACEIPFELCSITNIEEGSVTYSPVFYKFTGPPNPYSKPKPDITFTIVKIKKYLS